MDNIIQVQTRGNTNHVEDFLRKMMRGDPFSRLQRYGAEGVAALAAATPKDLGETAAAWRYEIKKEGSSYTLSFLNDHVEEGVNIAIIIQYGHGTGTGGYVAPRDYINPVIKPLFERMKADVWKEVRSS